MPAKITEHAKMICDKGASTAQLKVTSQNFCKAEDKLIATELDIVPKVNIPSFGICTITQKECMPAINSWLNTSVKDSINELKILTEASLCICSKGGKITIAHKGYTQQHEVM